MARRRSSARGERLEQTELAGAWRTTRELKVGPDSQQQHGLSTNMLSPTCSCECFSHS